MIHGGFHLYGGARDELNGKSCIVIECCGLESTKTTLPTNPRFQLDRILRQFINVLLGFFLAVRYQYILWKYDIETKKTQTETGTNTLDELVQLKKMEI